MTDPVLKEFSRGCSGLSRGCVGGAHDILPTNVFWGIASGFRSIGKFFGSIFG